MTNAQRVNELCKQIRGIALNYPAGMEQIVATVYACTHFANVDTKTEGHSIPEQQETETLASYAEGLALNPTPHSPESEVPSPETPQKRRGPGRPREQRTQG